MTEHNCTCHPPYRGSSTEPATDGRTITANPDPAKGQPKWLHADDNTPASTEHVHYERSSADCDGPHERSHTERIGDRDPDNFWQERVELLLSTWRPGTLQLTQPDPDRPEMVALWTAPTDEGYESEEATQCFDPACAYKQSRQRDVFAEMMGY